MSLAADEIIEPRSALMDMQEPAEQGKEKIHFPLKIYLVI